MIHWQVGFDITAVANSKLNPRPSKLHFTNVIVMRRELAFFFYFVFLVGLLCSRTILTIAMMGIFAIGLVEIHAKPFKIGFNPLFFKNIVHLSQRKELLAFMGIYFLIVLGAGNFNAPDAVSNARIFLPFLLLPLGFLQLPRLSQLELSLLFFIFIILASLVCIGVGINYALDFKYITNSINLGKSIPTPVHHIRFSLLVAFSVVVGIWLIYERFFWRKPWERYLIGGLTAFLFIFQHILSVRSGLVVMYAACGLMMIYLIFLSKKMWLFAVLVPLMFIVPLTAYWTIPSLQNKVRYLLYDLDMMRHGNLDGFSDGQRFISWKMGIDIIKEKPVLGIGMANLKDNLAERYQAEYPDLKPKKPHNQFLTIGAGTGLVGLSIFLVLFFTPLFYKKHYQRPPFMAFYTIIILSFLFENTLATSVGMSCFLFFALVMVQTDWRTNEHKT